MPFDVLVSQVADADLGPLLSRLGQEGYEAQVLASGSAAAMSAAVATASGGRGDLPTMWELVRELEGQTYSWPEYRERYSPYRIYTAVTRPEGAVTIALGHAIRANAWGRDRKYVIAFLTAGTPQTPLVEFLETDDHAETGELLAVIRGSDGAKKMYGPDDPLPDAYATLRTDTYNNRVDYPRAWNKLAVIAHADDTDTILNHALLQARRRKDI